MPAWKDSLTIALAQLNPVVGDLEGNAAKLRSARREAAGKGADLIVFPELFITGYPPEDLVRKPAFARAARSLIEGLAAETADAGRAFWSAAFGRRTAASTTRRPCSTAARWLGCGSRSTCPTTVCSTKSGCSTWDPCRVR